MEQWLFLVAILGTSVVAGAIGAILGLGGGIVLVPILSMFYGVNLRDAMGASIISVIATSSGAAAAYLRSGLSNIRIGLFLAMATVSGAIAGATLVGVVPETVLELILGLALAYSTLVTLRQLNLEIPVGHGDDPLAMSFELEGAYYDTGLDREVKYRAARVRSGLAAMFGAGILSGLLGIGSGAFKVLAMDYFMRLPMKVSTATSNFMIGITAAASAGIYFHRGDLRPLIVTPVALGVLIGAYLGTRLMTRLRNATLRKLFLPVILYLAVSMVLRGFGVPWP
ncbi:MAG: permease [Candidatus Rokubacteria bacterium 13_1_40CM_68_15]|nr:MAG: permease [Candidatus Rokubacteria bacterium 13_1_40CM_68_15]